MSKKIHFILSAFIFSGLILFGCNDDDGGTGGGGGGTQETSFSHNYHKDTLYVENEENYNFEFDVDPPSTFNQIVVTLELVDEDDEHDTEYEEVLYDRSFDSPQLELEDDFDFVLPKLEDTIPFPDGTRFNLNFEIHPLSGDPEIIEIPVYKATRLVSYFPGPNEQSKEDVALYPKGYIDEADDEGVRTTESYAFTLLNNSDEVSSRPFQNGEPHEEADIQDTAAHDPANRAIYANSSKNDTRFVLIDAENDINMDVVTNVEIFHEYETGNPVDIIENPEVGTAFVVRVKGNEALGRHNLVYIEEEYNPGCFDFTPCHAWVYDVLR